MNSAKKNNQSAGSVPGKNLGCVGIRHVWTDCVFSTLPNGLNYGACGIVVGSPNRFSSSGVVPFTAMLRNISMGLSVLCMIVLMAGKIHGEFKRVDTFTQILTLRQNALRFLAMEKNTEFLKRAIRTSYPALVRILCLLPTHAAFPHVKISNIKRQGNALGLKRHRMQWVVLYSITSSIFCQ